MLLCAFLIMHFYSRCIMSMRWRARRGWHTATAPAVDVVQVSGKSGAGSLSLPGETAAWYESTIYARVDGYVAKWYVDIGDHVKSGQVLALIDTPDLDAQLAAARAKLQVSQAQVKVKQADATFARSTYERWRDSPKGVVSEQEREDKKAGDAPPKRSWPPRGRRSSLTRRMSIACPRSSSSSGSPHLMTVPSSSGVSTSAISSPPAVRATPRCSTV